ncbi:MAG: Fpg/Nei family DNA glycosylase [Chloroflexi bacterium]|nr:Fpg/Nei family DNA glycosylase [Chloroflexota bacterium]
MPEGHTIHRLAREHTHALAGHVLHVWSPQGRHALVAAALDQHRLEHVDAHGKHLFYHWQDAPILHIHLGLFGSFRESASGSSPPRPSAQLRIEGPSITIELIGATTCELVDDVRRDQILDRLGPDLLADDAEPERAWQRLRRRSAPIATALLDQQLMSGVGNVYRLEALFVNGIHPERPANSLSRVEFDGLWETLRSMLRQGVEDRRIVTVHPSERAAVMGANGVESVPPEDAFYVYQQHRCRRCGGPIRAWRLGVRPAYACERCQR